MREILSITKHDGYEVRRERFTGAGYGVPAGENFEMDSAYTPNGDYIGAPEMAEQLVVQRGIQPQLRAEDSNTCTIGFSPKENKWFGWSHRAIAGFEIGDRLFKEDFADADENTPFTQHGAIVIETLDQARQAAVNFAESVS